MPDLNLPPSGAEGFDAEQFRLLIDTLKDYALVTFDTENRIMRWNVGAERLLGFAESEVLGRPGAIFFTPEDQAKGEVEREFRTAASEGRAQDERWHQRKDHTVFWGSGMMYALRDQNRQLRGYLKIFRDDTEHRKIEAELKEREEQLRLVVENVRDYALFQLNANGRVSVWNPGATRIFGYQKDEIVGQPMHRLLTIEDAESGYIEDELQRSLRAGGLEETRWMVRKDGTLVFARWITNPMLDDSGQLRGFVKVLQDETERKLQREERERAQAEQRALLESEVASRTEALEHTKEELRRLAASLLTAQEQERRRIARELHDDLSQRLARAEISLGDITLQLTAAGDIAAAHAGVRELRDEIGRLSADVRDLSHRLHPSVLDDLGLAAALRSLVQQFELKWPHPVVLSVTDVPDEIAIEVSYAFYRIAQEALRNIQKYAPTADVTVSLSVFSGELYLKIKDNGPGFDPDRSATGRGLGLVSMQERALLANARLAVDSQSGGGTRIEVRAPLREET